MKKLLSILLVTVFVLSFSTVTLSAVELSATPDEAKTITSLEVQNLPNKIDYMIDQIEAGWNISNVNFGVDQANKELYYAEIEKAVFFINVDLTGAVIVATYNDGSTEVIDNNLCTTSVADPVNLRVIYELMDNITTLEEAYAIEAMIIRNYTINVNYMGATTSFNVGLSELGREDLEDRTHYDFVSYTNPNELSYEITYVEELGMYYVDFDITGMTVTVKNSVTGELTTYGEDNIFIYFWFDTYEELADGELIAEGYVITDDGHNVIFDFPFTMNRENPTAPEETTTTTQPTTGNDAKSTTDTATNDTATKNTLNDAIQTGESVTVVLFIIMLSATAVAYIFYRKKTM